jgi:glycosyltransferase involved in cell wall biosynthesis
MRLIAHNDGRELRGNERQLLHLVLGLRERGHDVLVSCRAGAALAHELEERSIPHTGARPRGDLALPSALAFRRLLAEFRPDAVLLTSWKRVFLGSWLARSAGVPRVVARLGIVRAMPPSGTAAWKLRRAFERQVDALVVNSGAAAQAWLASAPWFAADRLRVIRNGVAVAAGDPAAIRRELGVPVPVRLIAAVAALEPRKGMDLLLRALALLPDDVHAVIAGAGPAAYALRALGVSLGVERRVHWLGARADVPDVLAASAAFVRSTRQDSVPNALLEAMACGIPVVSTRGNGAEEALGDTEGREAAGWIVPVEDPSALAAAISAALVDAKPKVAEARWRARHWFGVERMVEEYERVLSRPAGVAR